MPTYDYDYNKFIGQIAASLAHEVKNPLSLVKANIDLLELGDEEIQHKKNYRIMRREIDRINNLLMDFIQLTNNTQLNTKEIRIAPLIMEVIDIMKTSFSDTKKIDFLLDFHCSGVSTPVIQGDAEKLRRVFLNVIKNSIEAISGTGVIKVRVFDLEQDGKIKIVFEDNGKGIDKELLKKISTPFFTTKESGSGLGLYVSQTIISEHNGTFEIDNAADEGCAVTITLPKSKQVNNEK